MSNFLNNGFTNLNALTNIDADEIRTNALYVNGILIEPNSNIFDVITCSQLICQYDISANTIHAVTSIQGVPVAKYAFLLNVSSDIQAQFNNIATNYVTNSSLSSTLLNYMLISSLSNYVTNSSLSSTLSNYALISSLSNYVTNSSLSSTLSNYALISSLSNYVTNSSLSSTLSNYALISSLSNYVTNSSLSSTLSNYALISSLSNYATNSSVDTKIANLKIQVDANSVVIATNTTSIAALVIASASQQTQITALAGTVGAVQGELFIAEANIDTLQAKTSLLDVVGNYSHFSGYGIKMMNGIGYTVIINRIGDSQWYGLMSLLQGLYVENGIITDRVTIDDDLISNGASTLSTTTVNSTLNVTGVSTLANTNINGTLGVTGVSTLNTTNLATGNLTVTTGNLIVTAGKLEINSPINAPPNYFNNNSIFNGNILGSNINATNITSTELITGYDITSTHNITGYDLIINNNINVTNEITSLNLTSTNLSATNINCNNYNCSNSNGNNVVMIATNGGDFLSGNNITIGNLYSTTYIAGLVIFQGGNFNMSGLINQIGV